ncbi:dTDP-glucose 4,6-dehydratase 2 [Klebsiella variicola]|uniref:GDP-mannose 4,6-dehydratase n=1 Tax=Klebsiella variicola TaxID=244366 RepID=UPI00109CEC67|nr:GDP-mannose 4,6-dehydratase [Klebsiella variicola]VGQ11812.1 dTDP-glucose 4,6-dehydratase 2 [Klebsiella variicola]
MKTVFITGAGGAIGCFMLAKVLRETDWRVIATDSFNHKGYYDRINTILKDVNYDPERLRIVTHDLIAPFTERQIKSFGKIDYIINLASLSDVQDSIEDPVSFVMNNTALVLNMLELARRVEPESFIQFSTDEVYGPEEAHNAGHGEWDVILPSNPYSASKAAQEAIAIAYWRSYGVPVIITNTMNNFGEMQGASKFPAMVQSKLAKGESITIHCNAAGEIGSRYYIHSENTADAVLFLLQNHPAYRHKPGKIDWPDRYNIVGDAQVTNLELAELIANMMGKPLQYNLVNFHAENPGHDLHYGLDGWKLSSMGWKPPISFEDSLKRVIDWQLKNPEWME